VTLYHALPYGLHGPLRERVRPGQFVDVSPVMKEKTAMLACHRSQKEWLDKSQGVGSYVASMEEFTGEVGKMSGRFAFAEGWRRRSHLGFCGPTDDPLSEALGDQCLVDPAYEAGLETA
jgi:LmbE family N-acetylglucosaminyl deacetylase